MSVRTLPYKYLRSILTYMHLNPLPLRRRYFIADDSCLGWTQFTPWQKYRVVMSIKCQRTFGFGLQARHEKHTSKWIGLLVRTSDSSWSCLEVSELRTRYGQRFAKIYTIFLCRSTGYSCGIYFATMLTNILSIRHATSSRTRVVDFIRPRHGKG